MLRIGGNLRIEGHEFQFPWEIETRAPRSGDSHQSGACQRFRSEEHTSELQSRSDLVCRLLLEKKKEHLRPTVVGRWPLLSSLVTTGPPNPKDGKTQCSDPLVSPRTPPPATGVDTSSGPSAPPA